MEKFARVCDVTGEGMNEGWIWNGGTFYTSTKEITIAELKKCGDYPGVPDDELLEAACDADHVFWTQWYDEEDEDEDDDDLSN